MEENTLLSEKLVVNLKFRFSPLFFLLDQLIRIFILIAFLYYDFSVWIFVCIQVALLFPSGYLSDKQNEKIKKKYLGLVNNEYSLNIPEISVADNIPKYLMGYQTLFGYLFSFWFFFYIFDNHAWYHYIFIVILSIFGLILCMLSLSFSARYRISKGAQSFTVQSKKTIKDQNGIQKTITLDVSSKYSNMFRSGVVVEPEELEFDTVDLNDTKIAKLESELKNITYKAEAWLLESVFLGGLAFSGFLTVASANFLGKETATFQIFIEHISAYIDSCVFEDVTSFYTHIAAYFFRNDLYIIIMLLCLLSSVFFLLILTLRLRLNTLALNLDHILRISTIFNAKEEEIFNNLADLENNPNQVARFNKIQRKIEIALGDGEKLLVKIRPVHIMMNMFRTVAIILFYLVLVLSGFYFKPIVAVGIFGLAIFSFLFRKIETFLSINEITKRIRRH